MRKTRKLKKFVMPSVYFLLVALLVLSTVISFNTKTPETVVEDINYVSGVIWSNEIPVVSTDVLITKPYADNDKIVIAKYYYDYKGKEDNQKNSIIYYEGSYMQNSGIDYISEKVFDIKLILDGTVIKVEDNDLVGKTVEVRHENNIISVYQGLSEITIKEGDVLKQGNVIGKSGTSKVNNSLGNHLHLEIYVNGQVVDPENCYGKKPNEL